MATKYCHLYCNNPTVGLADGTCISEDGAETSPIAFTLNATAAEAQAQKLAIRCDAGYKTSGTITLSFDGSSKDKWFLAPDSSYATAADALAKATWADKLVISDSVGAVNIIFWVKAASSTDENPKNDESVHLVSDTNAIVQKA